MPGVFDTAIVGAGAAGLATGIFAARQAPAASVVVLEGARTIGAKILVSGGGRCNVTNDRVVPHDFNGGSRATIRRILGAFPAARTIEWFRDLKVPLHLEPLGKMFPDSNRARTVVDALVAECLARNVSVRTSSRVTGVEREADGFFIATSTGDVHARRLVLATGGLSLPKSGSDGAGYAFARRLGHTIVPTTPALAPLVLDGEVHAQLAGTSVPTRLTLAATGQASCRVDGAMLWTHFGISGPAALDVSRHWHRADIEGRHPRVTAAFAARESGAEPSSRTDFTSVERWWLELTAAHPRSSVSRALARRVPERMAEALVELAGVPPATTLTTLPRDARRRLIHSLSAYPLSIADSRGYNFAEVTAGGVALSEIDPGTMESRRCPGLFLVGEILDVDGRLGGFNFQWAWSSAWVAGRALSGR